MGLRLYNTVTRQKEPFRPTGKTVRMYVCGPTVYDYAHLGHGKAYVSLDVLRRYLEYRGWETVHVQNFTDIEDAITNRAAEEGVSPLALAERFIEAFLEDMDRLKVRRATHYPRVTEHIDEMIQAIQALLERGDAYVADGEVYMRATEDSFGRLSGRAVGDLLVEELPSNGPREGPLDFALWKRPKEGDPAWPSPWGEGRPGWHVECYAMATKYLGPTFDLHGGGMDLIFPHHESEALIAQALGGDFAHTWVHNGFMMIESEPMSKSLGNFITIREALRGFDWEVLRLFFLKTHYRTSTDYTEAALQATEGEYATLASALERLMHATAGSVPGEDEPLEQERLALRTAFAEAMDDDLDTPRAIAALLEFARRVPEGEALAATPLTRAYRDLCGYYGVLGLCEEQLAAEGQGR